MKCVLCGGKTIPKMIEYKELEIPFGRFKAESCEKCGESYFDENTAGEIQQKSKQLGLFGLAKKTTVAEVGNSMAIRIPKEIVSFLSLKRGMEVTLTPKSKHDLEIHAGT